MSDDKIIDFNKKSYEKGKEEILNRVSEVTGLTEENSNISEAFDEALERAEVYKAHDRFKEKELSEKYGVLPSQCYNGVCEYNSEGVCTDKSPAVGCIFRMVTSPPNSLSYNEYMPSHREALDMLEEHGLLKGDREEYLKVNKYYDKAESQFERSQTEIKGIKMVQVEACIKEVLMDNTFEGLSLLDEGDVDVLAKNILLEVEKAMGIYPNIKLEF